MSNGKFAGSLFLLASLTVLIACDDQKVVDPVDNVSPVVSLVGMNDGDVIGANQTITATATDDIGIARVHFLADGVELPGGVDTLPPYSFTLNNPDFEPGSAITFQALAEDAAGNIGRSPLISTLYLWDTVIRDPDETGNNLREIYLRSSPTTLDFRVVLSEPFTTSELNVAVFFDLDGDTATGLTVDDSLWYYVPRTGPELMALFSNWCDLHRWNDDNDSWGAGLGLEGGFIDTASGWLEGSIALDKLGSPADLHLIVGQMTNGVITDWMPDRASVMVTLNRNYIGEPMENNLPSESVRPFERGFLVTERRIK